MKTFFLTLALLAACCTALVPTEFRNLTTTEIDYNYHVQTLIPKGLEQVLQTNQLQNQFNTTDFILDKTNFVSQKEFKNGYIYKVNVDFINSAGEIAHTQFIGTYNTRSRKFSVYSLTYTVQYPQMDYNLEEKFKPNPINGTHSTGIYKDLRNYIQENFNNTQGYLSFRNATMYNSTYLPQDYNMSSTYDVPQNYSNYSSDSYNNTWINKTYSEYDGPSRIQNGTNNTTNWTNSTYLSSNQTLNNDTFGANITESVYKSLNMLVDMFNSTDLEIEEIDLDFDLEPLIGTVFEFVSKRLGESFGVDFEKIMADFIDFETSNETMPDNPKKDKSVFA